MYIAPQIHGHMDRVRFTHTRINKSDPATSCDSMCTIWSVGVVHLCQHITILNNVWRAYHKTSAHSTDSRLPMYACAIMYM